jgi:hypothetical protein
MKISIWDKIYLGTLGLIVIIDCIGLVEMIMKGFSNGN